MMKKQSSSEKQKTQNSSEGQSLYFHHASFAPNLPQNVSQLLSYKKIRDALSLREWRIEYGRFGDNSWDLIFSFMISASCSELWLDCNNQQKIIMSISKTNFMELKQLILCDNNITSIEQLQFINMPLLEGLILRQNNITNSSALSKCKWNNLNVLDLYENQIEQLKIERLQISDIKHVMKEYYGDHNTGQNWIAVSAKTYFNEIRLYESTESITPSKRILESLKAKKIKNMLH